MCCTPIHPPLPLPLVMLAHMLSLSGGDHLVGWCGSSLRTPHQLHTLTLPRPAWLHQVTITQDMRQMDGSHAGAAATAAAGKTAATAAAGKAATRTAAGGGPINASTSSDGVNGRGVGGSEEAQFSSQDLEEVTGSMAARLAALTRLQWRRFDAVFPILVLGTGDNNMQV